MCIFYTLFLCRNGCDPAARPADESSCDKFKPRLHSTKKGMVLLVQTIPDKQEVYRWIPRLGLNGYRWDNEKNCLELKQSNKLSLSKAKCMTFF